MVGNLSSVQSQKKKMYVKTTVPTASFLSPGTFIFPSLPRLLKSDRLRRQSPLREPFALPGESHASNQSRI